MSLSDMPIVTRTFADADLEVRSDGRTIYGLAVPFGVPTPIRDAEGDYFESFERGAFARTINGGALQRVKLFAKHDRKSLPLGRATELREDSRGLVASLHVSKTRNGDEIIELVRDGALDQLSIGFRPVRTSWDDLGAISGMRSTPAAGVSAARSEVRLDEISVVDYAAYPAAAIAGVRGTSDDTPDGAVVEPAEPTIEPAVRTSLVHQYELRLFRQRVAHITRSI